MIDASWVDQNVSAELPSLRLQGEGQTLEFKSSFPRNAQDLGHGVAAFATSNHGRILIGVANNGDLVGVPEALLPKGRDDLALRVAGICRNNVKPAVTPTITFAVENEKVVIVLSIAKGSHPVYYYNGRPYVRHASESRPAEPHEVVEFVKKQLVASGELTARADKQRTSFLEALAVYAIDILIYSSEFEDRCFDPWLERFQNLHHVVAENVASYAAEELAREYRLREVLLTFADACEAVSCKQLYVDSESWTELESLVAEAVVRARTCLDMLRGTPDWHFDSNFVNKQIQRSSSQLSDLSLRAKQMIDANRVKDARSTAAQIGRRILQALNMVPSASNEEQREMLASIARRLHLLETECELADGGVGEAETLKTIHDCAAKLRDLPLI